MEITDVLKVFEDYNLWLIILGIATVLATILPRVLSDYPLSTPMALLVLGFAVIALPLGLEIPLPQEYPVFIEHVTELGVILSLMGAGLNIDRPPSFKGWNSTFRLLAITMPITIALTALLGWWAAALAPASAMLLGAVVAPTDPVLATEVKVGAPQEGLKKNGDKEAEKNGREAEEEWRFALTSEAGLNDGLAFPFTHMAVAMALAGLHPENWLQSWVLISVLYKLIVGTLMGLGMGYLLARFILNLSAETELAKAIMGLGALAATLLIYGATEYIGGYGFIATFVGAVTIRNYEPEHVFHTPMHILMEKTERIFTSVALLALGGAIATGLLAPLTWPLIICALIIIFVIRPLSGMIALIGFQGIPNSERLAISFLGIRGIGSLYYLAYAMNEADFAHIDQLWAVTALLIVISVFVHGFSATPITQRLGKWRTKSV